MKITKENIKELVGRTIKSKDKSVHWVIKIKSVTFDTVFFETVKGNVGRLFEHNIDCVLENINSEKWILLPQEETPQHYDNTNGSLYLFAEQHGLNAWEFDILKRVVRCRKKGEFETDLKKTIEVINLYLKEYEPNTTTTN
jgi:hypothetical protein